MNILRQLINLALSQTARNTYFVFWGNSLAMFFGFIFTVVLARLLSLSDFGYFSALLSLLFLTSDIADIGIGNSLSRFLPTMEKQKRRLLSFLKTAFFLQILVATVVAGFIFSLSIYISNVFFHNLSLSTLVRATSVGILGSVIGNFFLYTLLARQKFITASFFTALGGFLRLVILFLLIGFSSLNLKTIVWGQAAGFIIIAIAGIILVKPKFLTVKFMAGDFVRLVSFSTYLGIARGLTAVVSKLDVLMLIALTNSTEAGIYSLASRVISIYPLLSGSFTNVIAPKITLIKVIKDLEKFLLKVIFGTLGLIFSIFLLIIFASPFMVVLFGPEKGLPAVVVFRLLLVSMIFFVGSIPAVSLATYYLKKPHILTINSILQLLIVIGGNFYFIPRFGRLGPAISLIAAYGITLFLTSSLSFYYLKKR